MEYTVHNLEEMEQAAADLVSKYLDEHKKVFFYGEMGAGKTTFIKMICKAMGVKNQTSSPTFSLVNCYELPEKHLFVNHADLYRLKDADEAFNAGIYELFGDDDYFFVEWPEKVETFSSGKLLKVLIIVDAEDIRHIKLSTE